MEQNANISLLPSAGGHIMAMRGGGVPAGFDPNASVIQLTPNANHVPIVDMKGGDETLPMAAAATVVSAPGVVGPATKTPMTPPKEQPKEPVKTPGKPIQIILFGKTFNAFSTEVNTASQPILALLGDLTDAEKSAALQKIYDGIVNLRTITLDASPHLKRLFIRMGIDYAKEKKELTEEPIHLEQTDIKLAFPNGKVEVTLTIKCDQLPSCSQKNFPMAAAATTMKGGDGERIIKLFGKEYTFPNRPTTINDHEDLLEELEVKEKGDTFKLTLLEEIYDGCYTDRSVISDIKCSTFGTLLEELGQKYAINIHELLRLNITAQKNGESIKQKKYPNGDLEFTFTFSNFGKQIGEETKKKIKAASEKAASSNGFFTKLTADPVSSNQVSIRGMVNPNNACFCISSIQLLFSIPQIRTSMKEYGKKNCNDAMLAEIYSQIEHPEQKMTKVNQDGVLCALFHLFEELGENMTLFSRVTADILSDKNAVPYEFLGYIMKNFEIDSELNKREYHIGGQEDAQVFLTFLFEIFDEIRQLFQFTQERIIDHVENVVDQPSQQNDDKKSQAIVWTIPDRNPHTFSTSYDGTRKQPLLKINSVTNEPREVMTDVHYHDTLRLEKNPYLLVQVSDPNKDLSGIPHEFSINKGENNKQFKLYGMIRRSGPRTNGHYKYDRQDLTSDKHIVYSDSDVTLDNNKIQMTQDGFNAYLLVYAEAESPAKAPEKASEKAPEMAPVKSVATSPATLKATSSSVSLAAAPLNMTPIPNPKAQNMINDLMTGTYTLEELETKYCTDETCKPYWADAFRHAEKFPNNSVSQYIRGYCYFYGRGGLEEDEITGVNLFLTASNQGLVDAQFMLGNFTFNGQGIAKNEKEGNRLIEQAANQGYPYAEYVMGYHYEKGRGVAKNENTAIKWYRQADAHGIKKATSALKRLKATSGGMHKEHNASRTLRASKQSPKKKRTLRASKKLRQSSNKA
jgi:TPR repeat protein